MAPCESKKVDDQLSEPEVTVRNGDASFFDEDNKLLEQT